MIAFDPMSAAALMTAAMLGAMLFFAGVVAPAIFSHFPAAAAGSFVRRLFPRYYDVLAVASTLAAIFAFGTAEGAALALIALLFVFSRVWLMPRINEARDSELQDNENAKHRFNRLHSVSVLINIVQIVALFIIVVRFV